MALKDITLGQYFPGNTVIHRLDPRTKLLFTVLYIVALFSAKGGVTYAVLFAVLCASIAVSRIHPRNILRGMKPILFIIVLTAVLNIFYTPGDPIWQWKFLKITVEGLEKLLKASQIPLYATALREDTVDVRQADLGRAAVVIGSEGRGVSQALLDRAEQTVKIPMRSRCESLNAASAAVVVLWEMGK